MKITIENQNKNHNKPKGISNVFKLKKMLQSAICEIQEPTKLNQIVINQPISKSVTHSQTILNKSYKFFNNNKDNKKKTSTNKIKVCSSTHDRSISDSVNRLGIFSGNNDNKQNIPYSNSQTLNNSIKSKKMNRVYSSYNLSTLALQQTHTKKLNNINSVKNQLKQNIDSEKISPKCRKIQIIDAPIVQQKAHQQHKMLRSQSAQQIFHKKFKKMKQNSHIVTKQVEERTTSSFKTSYSPQKKIQNKKININRFNIGKKLGKGRFGNVYMAEDKITGFMMAIKIVEKKQVKQAKMEDQLIMEIKLQTYMNHPNILKMYAFFHDQTNFYLLLQLGDECLFKTLRKRIKFMERETAYYTKQIIQGLKYLHCQNIIHRDIKPQNVMVINNVVKIADFGWSVYSVGKRQTFCGTLDYVPPQIVNGDSYDETVDVWSLGILIYELSTGKAPFQGNTSQQQTFRKISQAIYQIPTSHSNDLQFLIKKILNVDPTIRIDLKQIQNSQWLRNYEKEGRSIKQQIWHFWEQRRNQ